MNRSLTAVVRAEDDVFVALCPELDVASQGETRDAAIANLREAVELFFECASDDEVKRRLGGDVYVTQLEVAVG
ncbi:MAG: type II toxin-antitoxin system HicB family antitoxin [Lacipirellulaceae bacterium]